MEVKIAAAKKQAALIAKQNQEIENLTRASLESKLNKKRNSEPDGQQHTSKSIISYDALGNRIEKKSFYEEEQGGGIYNLNFNKEGLKILAQKDPSIKRDILERAKDMKFGNAELSNLRLRNSQEYYSGKHPLQGTSGSFALDNQNHSKVTNPN